MPVHRQGVIAHGSFQVILGEDLCAERIVHFAVGNALDNRGRLFFVDDPGGFDDKLFRVFLEQGESVPGHKSRDAEWKPLFYSPFCFNSSARTSRSSGGSSPLVATAYPLLFFMIFSSSFLEKRHSRPALKAGSLPSLIILYTV